MNEGPVLALFKFGERRYIDEFVRGRLFMNTLAHFAQVEASTLRRDSREGQEHWFQTQLGTSLAIKIDGSFKPIAGIIGPIAFTPNANLETNVFCMYALRASAAKCLVDPRNFEFGDTFAIPVQGDEFLRRVREAARHQNYTLKSGLLEYFDSATHHGQVGLFRKAIEFEYQSEFRIAIVPGTGAPCILDVGNLSDLMITGPLSQLNNLLRVERTPDGKLITQIAGRPERG